MKTLVTLAAIAASLMPVPATAMDFETWMHSEATKAVVHCESRGIPTVTNGPYWGLLQIDVDLHADRIADHGYEPVDMLTEHPNLEVGFSIWQERGWKPWPSCGRGW
jgi:hypothetical protein